MAQEKELPEILTEGDLAQALQASAVATAEGEEPEITECFIGDEEGTVLSAADMLSSWSRRTMRSMGDHRVVSQEDALKEEAAAASTKVEVKKTARGTTQQQSELGHNKFQSDLSRVDIIEPPYPPELLSAFLEVDETHFRCVRTKVTDSVGRAYTLEPCVNVKPDEDNTRDRDGRPVKAKEQSSIIPVQSIGVDIDLTPNFMGGLPGTGLPGSIGSTSLSYQENGGSDNKGLGNIGGANSDQGHISTQNRKGKFRSFMEVVKSAVLGAPVQDLEEEGGGNSMRKRVVSQEEVDHEAQLVEDFIEDANEVLGFEGVLDRAAMDYEAIGWSAIEVIRSVDMKVRRIAHAPAVRMRALKGWRGYVEIISHDRSDGSQVHRGKYVYYQPFGSKVISKRVNPITKAFEPYDPRIDGPVSPAVCQWNITDRETGLPTDDLTLAANEIIWIPRHHSNTIYYGFTDVVPALGWLLANVHIRDYLLQFFEHNTVPRYAIIIEGAKLSESVKKAITAYFGTHVKGKAHKTLIIPIPAMRGEVKVRFEKLDADGNEGSFQETKKNNAQAIMTAHGVSPAIIGIADKAELGSGKGLSQAEIYKDRIITPSQRYWAGKINRMLRMGLGIQLVRLRFNPLDIRDEKAEQEIATAYLQNGITSINEIRKRLGLGGPVAGGDRHYIIIGQVIMFVDEMTEAMGTEREQLEQAISENEQQMALQAVKTQQKQANSQGPSNGKKPDNAGRSSSGTAKKPTTVGGSRKS